MNKKQIIYWAAGIGLIAVLAGADVANTRWQEYQADKTMRADWARNKIRNEEDRKRLVAGKAGAISAALANPDPDAGLKSFASYSTWEDADILATRERLETAIRVRKVAKAKKLLAEHNVVGAQNEIEKYSGINDPEIQSLFRSIRAINEREQAVADRGMLAARKKDGVNIGMTAERVLQSSWGRPERVNRTTLPGGVREQWVYPGYHNYLYFENGVLTSIQN